MAWGAFVRGGSHIFSVLLLILMFLNTGCGQFGGTVESSAPPLTQLTEAPYCGGSILPGLSDPYTVTAAAVFKYRVTVINLSSNIIGLYGISERPIEYAEVHVLNSNGQQVQCGETGVGGIINLQIPKSPGSYTLRVFSRSDNSKLKARVLKDINSNEPHFIEKSFSIGVESAQDLGTLTAQADESISSTVEGGAFNILRQLLLANEHIRNKTGNSSFVADSVKVYWKAGFNPYTYFASGDSDPLSFYIPGDHELYISGGKNGNVKSQDTDHFDNAVILHEYGHFLEDVYGKSESPGGSHNGDFIIDPRLAWSEGWANYYQASVIKEFFPDWQYYLDSVGYYAYANDPEAGYLVGVNLSHAPGLTEPDSPVSAGEGVFHELSISRTLYKSEFNADVSFSDVWDSFKLFKTDTSYPFKNFGRFLELLSEKSSASANASFSSVLTEEKQNNNAEHYASLLGGSSTTCWKNLSPVRDTALMDSSGRTVDRSNLFASNDFFRYYYSGNADTLTLQYSTISGSTQDLDIYVYSYEHVLTEEYYLIIGEQTEGLAKYSRRVPILDGGSESINMSGLSPGWYLINVKANTYGKSTSQLNGTAQYQLRHTTSSLTEYLCPNF